MRPVHGGDDAVVEKLFASVDTSVAAAFETASKPSVHASERNASTTAYSVSTLADSSTKNRAAVRVMTAMDNAGDTLRISTQRVRYIGRESERLYLYIIRTRDCTCGTRDIRHNGNA